MRKRLLFAVPVVAVLSGAVWLVASPASAMPAGTHTVEVFTVDEPLSSAVPPQGRPGFLGRLLGMCDADTHYVTDGDSASCLVLSGPAGEIQVSGTDAGPQIDPAAAARAHDMAVIADPKATRLVLEYDGDPVAIVELAALRAGHPVTADPLE